MERKVNALLPIQEKTALSSKIFLEKKIETERWKDVLYYQALDFLENGEN